MLRASKPKTLEQRLDSRTSERRASPVHYAVLFSGCSDPGRFEFKENLHFACTAAQINGYLPEDIFIFGPVAEKMYHAADAPSREALRMMMSYLSENLGEEDVLLLYLTGHGRRTNRDYLDENGIKQREKISMLRTPGLFKDISEMEMAAWLSALNPRTGVLVYDQCYSGGFAQRTGKGKYVAVSASKPDEKSNWNTFAKAFFRPFTSQVSKPSVKEAFSLALSEDMYAVAGKQTPQIFSDIDSSTVYLG